MSMDDAVLVAYLDGELDPKAVREVEAALERDPGARARVEAMRDSAALARAALNSVVHESIPDRLCGVLKAAAKPSDAAPVPRWQWGKWLRRTETGMALAASLAVLVIGIGGGYVVGQNRAQLESASVATLDSQDRILRNTAFQDALERKVSGTSATWANPDASHRGEISPVRTFKDHQGLYCREFREVMVLDQTESTIFGVACRQPGDGWREKFRLIPAEDLSAGI